MAKTVEERFILALYKLACEEGEWDVGIAPDRVIQEANLRQKAAHVTIRVLCQTNFIRKRDNLLFLTKNGLQLVETLLN